MPTRHDDCALKVTGDVEERERDSTTNSGHEHRHSRLEFRSRDEHSPRSEVGQPECSRLDRIDIADIHNIHRGCAEELLHGPGGMLANHANFLARTRSIGMRFLFMDDGGVEQHPATDPCAIDPFPHFDDSTSSIGTTRKRILRFDTRQSLSDPEIKAVECRSFGLHQDLPRDWGWPRDIAQERDIRRNWIPTLLNYDGFHGVLLYSNEMRKLHLLAHLVVVVCFVATATTDAYAQKATIIADPESIELGFIEPRSTVTKTFRLANTSHVPVTIATATPTCTCTTIDAVGKVIPAQGSLEIPMTMKVAASTGVKTAAVTFTYSDRSAPTTLRMSGEISYPVRASAVDVIAGARAPYLNLFDDPSRRKDIAPPPTAGTIRVASTDRQPFRVLSVMNAPPNFAGFDPAKDPPGNSYEIVFDFSAVPCAQMPPYMVIETDHPLAPVVDLRIRHMCTKIAPQIPFAEYRANLGALTTGVAHPFDFELKKSTGWRVVQTTSKDPRLTVKLMDQRSDSDHAMVSMAIVVDPSVHGVVLAPVTMVATDPSGTVKSSDFWVYFTTHTQATAKPVAIPIVVPIVVPTVVPTAISQPR